MIEVEELLARKGLKTNHTANRPLNNLQYGARLASTSKIVGGFHQNDSRIGVSSHQGIPKVVSRGNTAGMLFPNKQKGMARATQKTGSTNINSFTAASHGGKRSRPQTTGKYPGIPVDPAADFSSNCDTSNHNRPVNSNTDLIVGNHHGKNMGANAVQGKDNDMAKYH